MTCVLFWKWFRSMCCNSIGLTLALSYLYKVFDGVKCKAKPSSCVTRDDVELCDFQGPQASSSDISIFIS